MVSHDHSNGGLLASSTTHIDFLVQQVARNKSPPSRSDDHLGDFQGCVLQDTIFRTSYVFRNVYASSARNLLRREW